MRTPSSRRAYGIASADAGPAPPQPGSEAWMITRPAATSIAASSAGLHEANVTSVPELISRRDGTSWLGRVKNTPSTISRPLTKVKL